MSQPTIKLYGFPLSGHSHRVELMLSLLGLPNEFILVDLKQGAHKTPEFIANLNRFGQVPVIDDGGTVFGAEVDTVSAINRAYALLNVMEQQLGESRFLAGDQPSIADIAFYTYVAHAPEGNVSLSDYPEVRAWLASIEALPGFVAMPRTAVGLQSQ